MYVSRVSDAIIQNGHVICTRQSSNKICSKYQIKVNETYSPATKTNPADFVKLEEESSKMAGIKKWVREGRH